MGDVNWVDTDCTASDKWHFICDYLRSPSPTNQPTITTLSPYASPTNDPTTYQPTPPTIYHDQRTPIKSDDGNDIDVDTNEDENDDDEGFSLKEEVNGWLGLIGGLLLLFCICYMVYYGLCKMKYSETSVYAGS